MLHALCRSCGRLEAWLVLALEQQLADMVKEGGDSTYRPKVQTYEFDGGRLFLDSWAADGKPMLSRTFRGWARVFGVVTLTGVTALVLSDWGMVAQNRDHVFSPVQRSVFSWWSRFTEIDAADVAKARPMRRDQNAKSG